MKELIPDSSAVSTNRKKNRNKKPTTTHMQTELDRKKPQKTKTSVVLYTFCTSSAQNRINVRKDNDNMMMLHKQHSLKKDCLNEVGTEEVIKLAERDWSNHTGITHVGRNKQSVLLNGLEGS